MRGVAGCHIKQHLHDFHLADIDRIMVATAVDHMAQGCEFKPGWRERIMAKVLDHLPDFIGDALEEEETFCPERGISVKEAA
jgi:hypothetical protein